MGNGIKALLDWLINTFFAVIHYIYWRVYKVSYKNFVFRINFTQILQFRYIFQLFRLTKQIILPKTT